MSKTENISITRRALNKFRRTIIAGLIFLLPIVITYLILRLLFNLIDNILQPGVEAIIGKKIPGLGFVILIALVYVLGLLGSNILGKWFVRITHNFFLRVPVVNIIYSAAKQLIESFSGDGTTGFKRVVLIEYPRIGIWTIGFLTQITSDENGKPMALVYIPTAPTPNSGWLAIVPVEEVYDTNMSIQEALSMVFSGGIIAPPQIKKLKQNE